MVFRINNSAGLPVFFTQDRWFLPDAYLEPKLSRLRPRSMAPVRASVLEQRVTISVTAAKRGEELAI